MFSNFEAMKRFHGIEFFSKNFFSLYINLLILVMLVLSLAGTSISFYADTSAYSYVIAIDNSQSMKVSDISPNRLEAAKREAKRFVDLMPVGVEIGVISFSGNTIVMQELDRSKIKAKMAIDNIDFGNIPGTNIYDALISANKLFQDRQMKAVIILTDGQLNIGDAPQIIRYANRNNLVIHTVAIGTKEGAANNYGLISKADEDFLRSLSFNTHGKFFSASDLKSLEDSFNELIYHTNREVRIDLSFYLLIGAIILFTFYWIIYNFRFRFSP